VLSSDDPLVRNSYYEASTQRTDRYAPLQTDIACDVCVVGAGLAGLSAAIDLAEAGFTVAVLEARQVAGGLRPQRWQALVGLCVRHAGRRATAGSYGGTPGVGYDRGGGRTDPRALPAASTSTANGRMGSSRPRSHHAGRRAQAVGRYAGARLRLRPDYGSSNAPNCPSGSQLPISAAAFDAGSGQLHPLKYTLSGARPPALA